MNIILPPCTSSAMQNHVHGSLRAESRAATPPNLSPSYERHIEPNIQLLADQVYLQPTDDGYTCGSEIATAPSESVNDAQPQASAHAAAYKSDERLANHCNGAPLATIIEQGSYSTLNSHESLLSNGRLPLTKAAETTSPTRGSRRRSRSLDDKALHSIQEDLGRDFDTFAVAVPQAWLDENHDPADPASGTATPLTSYRFEMGRSPSSCSVHDLSDHDDRKVKGFIRGVLQNMRGVPRARSRSSSLSYAHMVEHRDSPRSTSEGKPRSDQQSQSSRVAHLSKHGRNSSTCSFDGAAILVAIEDQTKGRVTSSSGMELSAWAQPPQIPCRSDTTESGHGSGSSSSVFPHQTATCAHERPFSTPIVRAARRDLAPEDGTAHVATSHHHLFDTSAQYRFNGIPMYSRKLSSHQEMSSATDVFTNQNASFCSTMSTSYSGTVLGVDLDLQHNFICPIRRSQSPPAPVWFTPQVAELERQGFVSEPPKSAEACAATQAPCHSIKSSALTSLLPIAAASGIVQPNYNTPTISFYSPSGNLIQPESSPSHSTSQSDDSGSITTTTSYYTRQNNNAATTAETRTPRSLLLPMTTPPTQRTPIPLHLRHHHNYRHPEMTQINSHELYVTRKGPVKGCDGIVRDDSLSPRSGVFSPHGIDRDHRSAKLIMHDLKAEAKFYKARFLARAAAQSFAPSIPEGKTTKKHRLHNYNTYDRKSHFTETETRKGRFVIDALGPFAAHAMRVCFCQPYDGAETSTCASITRAYVSCESLTEDVKSKAGQSSKNAEHLLPNARVVGSNGRSECGDTKRSTRRDSAFRGTVK
ncbi:hypothetical protein SVAN01_02500 [Stagonosporopsis vannaccii]|nr:hypothetical protein SVAN01_02500 [Stagonosporopsis vannaccii]